jgi:hypothetical protein
MRPTPSSWVSSAVQRATEPNLACPLTPLPPLFSQATPLTDLPALHHKMQIPLHLTAIPSHLRMSRLRVYQPDNTIVPIQPLQQRDLVHVALDRLAIRLFERDSLDREDLVLVGHDAVHPGGATLADEVETNVWAAVDL